MEKGYTGSYSNIRMYIKKLKKKNTLTYNEIIPISKLKSLLFHKRKEDSFPKKYLNTIYLKFPLIKKLFELFFEFKSILFTIKKEKYFNSWIEKAKKLNLTFINAFVKGIERDLAAVKASIQYNYSNGIVESKVNTVKLVKRIMYGRSSFQMIKNKALRLQNFIQSYQ